MDTNVRCTLERAASDEAVVDIRPDGTVRIIAGDLSYRLASAIGHGTPRRASHVEPAHWAKRMAFRLLRATESRRLRDWTRTWGGSWTAKVIGGPYLGTFPSRQQAIDAEMEHLTR